MTHIRPELRPGTDTGTDTVPRTPRRPSAAFSAMNQLKYRSSGPVQDQNMKRKIIHKIKCTKNQKVQKKCMISTIYGEWHISMEVEKETMDLWCGKTRQKNQFLDTRCSLQSCEQRSALECGWKWLPPAGFDGVHSLCRGQVLQGN